MVFRVVPACLTLLAIALVVVGGSEPLPAQRSAATYVTVTLRSQCLVQGPVVLLGDVARIECRDASTVKRLAALDVADSPEEGKVEVLDQARVAVRLQLDGLSNDEFRIVGAAAAKIRRGAAGAYDDAAIVFAVRRALARQLDVEPGDLWLQPRKPIRLRADYSALALDELQFDVHFPARPHSTIVYAQIGVHVHQRLHEVVHAAFDLVNNARVPRASRNIRAGEIISDANVVYVRQRGTRLSFGQGMLSPTTNPLDLAIQGPDFFKVSLPDGRPRYTRNGALHLNEAGELVTSRGLPLEPRISFGSDIDPGSVMVSQDGTIKVIKRGSKSTINIGQIQLYGFRDASQLRIAGDGLLAATEGSGYEIPISSGPSGSSTILQRFLEEPEIRVLPATVRPLIMRRNAQETSRAIRSADRPYPEHRWNSR